jgi:hypothetical protein
MKPFDVKRSCIKCGNKGRRLIDGNEIVIFRAAASTEYLPDKNKLLRTCKRCSYQWLELCFDE